MKRYFFMEQDKRIEDSISFRSFDVRGSQKIFWPEDADKVNDTTILYLKKNSGETEMDFLQSPVNMVSEKVYRVFSMYQGNIIFKRVMIIHKERKKLYFYYIPLIHRVNALADCVERYPNGQEKKVILDKSKIGMNRVFFLEGSNVRRPIISIEVMESLLRRNLIGVIFQEIEVV